MACQECVLGSISPDKYDLNVYKLKEILYNILED